MHAVSPTLETPLSPIDFHPRRPLNLSLMDVGLLQKENEKIVHEIQLLSVRVNSSSSLVEETSQEIKETQRKIENISGKTFDNTQSILRNQKDSITKIDELKQDISSVNSLVQEVNQRQEPIEDGLSKLITSHNKLLQAFNKSQEKQKETDLKIDQILSILQSR